MSDREELRAKLREKIRGKSRGGRGCGPSDMKQKIRSDPQGALLSMGVDNKDLLESLPSLLKGGDPKQALRSILHPQTSSERKDKELEKEEEREEEADSDEEEEEAPPCCSPPRPPC